EGRLVVTVDDAEVIVEPGGVRPGHEWRVPIDRALPLYAQVPLADAAGRVTGALEQTGHGRLAVPELVRLARVERAGHAVPARRVAAGQEPEARRRARGIWRVLVGEFSPLARQPVAVRRGHFRGAVAGEVAVTHVVCHDEDDVGPRGGVGRPEAGRSQRREE